MKDYMVNEYMKNIFNPDEYDFKVDYSGVITKCDYSCTRCIFNDMKHLYNNCYVARIQWIYNQMMWSKFL